MVRHADAVVATIEGDELRLEEDIAINLKVCDGAGLHATEAGWRNYVSKMLLLSRWEMKC